MILKIIVRYRFQNQIIQYNNLGRQYMRSDVKQNVQPNEKPEVQPNRKPNKVTEEIITEFKNQLQKEEKSDLTIQKYMRDIRRFQVFLSGNEIRKEIVIAYKKYLKSHFAATSVNSMLAALNRFLQFCGLNDICVKQLRVQKKPFRSSEKELNKEEYLRLLNTAKASNNERMFMILQTIASTGIRISELKYFKIEEVKLGEITVSSKNKTRIILIPKKLKKVLIHFSKKHGIKTGEIFITKGGKSLNRSNIWAEMKKLCQKAGVSREKVFPHNLRKLFARCFYELKKDIAKLADVLGHSSINTTRIYIMTSGYEHQRDIDKLGLIL